MSRIISYIVGDLDDDCLITVRYVGAIFYILWSPSNLATAPDLLEDYLANLRELKDEDANQATPLKRLVLPFRALMDQLAPKSKQAPFFLYEYLYPQWFQLEATAAEDRQNVQSIHANVANSPFCHPGVALRSNGMSELDLNKWVPRCFSSHDIKILADGERHPPLYTPSKVITKESRTEYFFKGFGAEYRGAIPELTAFRAINYAIDRGDIPSDTRICRLHGLVVDTFGPASSNTRLVGMLLNYIEPKRCGIRGTLQYIAREEQSKSHIRRWVTDLDNIIVVLHQAGCVWGDAKPENVLIDNNNDVWVIDFGGGFTPGWVDERHQCSKKGDLEGLQRIRQWLEPLGADQ